MSTMKIYLGASLLITFLIPMTTLASDQGCTNNGDPVAVENVRSLRKEFNLAIAEKDIQSIENVLHENVLLITGTDSNLYKGINAQLAIWREDFASVDRAVYVRTPRCIRVSSAVSVALEYGTWRGEREISTESFAAGSYAAKWRKVNGRWHLESEIYATETCGGEFCPTKVSGE